MEEQRPQSQPPQANRIVNSLRKIPRHKECEGRGRQEAEFLRKDSLAGSTKVPGKERQSLGGAALPRQPRTLRGAQAGARDAYVPCLGHTSGNVDRTFNPVRSARFPPAQGADARSPASPLNQLLLDLT